MVENVRHITLSSFGQTLDLLLHKFGLYPQIINLYLLFSDTGVELTFYKFHGFVEQFLEILQKNCACFIVGLLIFAQVFNEL